MGLPAIVIDNSFSKLQGFSPALVSQVKQALTYKDIETAMERKRLYMMLKTARRKNLQTWYYSLKAQYEALPPDIVCWLDGERFCTGHLSLVKAVIEKAGVVYEFKDLRKVPSSSLTLRWSNKPHEMRYYQQEAVKAALEKGRGVIEQAVGTGKTLIATYLIKELAMNTLFIVPSSALLTQAADTFELAFGSKYVERVSTKTLKAGKKLKPIRVATIQTLASLQKQKLLDGVLKDIDVLFIDECHHSASVSFVNLLPHLDHVYHRYSLTGTFLRNDSKTLDLWGMAGDKLYEFNAASATAEGYLTPVQMNVVPLHGVSVSSYPKEYSTNYSSLEFLKSLLSLIRTIPEKDQILVLVDRKEACGNLIDELLKREGYNATYITGDSNKKDTKDAIEHFNEKKIRILIASQVLGEGCDIRSTNHLILARGGKSEIALVQGIGRAVRLYPGKHLAHVWDFNFQYARNLNKHLKQRMEMFKRQFAGRVIPAWTSAPSLGI